MNKILFLAVLGVMLALVFGACRPPTGPGGDPVNPADLHLRQGVTDLPAGTGTYAFEPVMLVDGDGGHCCSYVDFTVENLGQQNLVISSVELGGADALDFDLDTQSLAPLLEPSYLSFFSVRFDPLDGLGRRSCTITINSNDEQQPAYTIAAAGGGMRRIVRADRTEDNQFGGSVAVSGETVVVPCPRYADGSSWNQGALHVFYRNQDGTDRFGQIKTITAASSFGGYGGQVAIDGDTLVTGAGGQGVVYVYYRDAGGADNWGEVKQITVSDSTEFGSHVAVHGDVLVVSQSDDDIDGRANQGSAHVFYRNRGGTDNWGQVKKLTAAGGAENDRFGVSATVHGGTIVVGAHGVDAFYSAQGAAFVYSRDAGGADNWGQVKRLTASDGAENAYFGWSVDIESDTLVVGAAQSSYVYVFERDAGGPDYWGEVKKLAAASMLSRDVALSADLIAACSYMYESARGAVYLFARDQGGAENWGQVLRLTAADGTGGDIFGSAVACDGEVVLVGASGDDGSRGAAYVYVHE